MEKRAAYAGVLGSLALVASLWGPARALAADASVAGAFVAEARIAETCVAEATQAEGPEAIPPEATLAEGVALSARARALAPATTAVALASAETQSGDADFTQVAGTQVTLAAATAPTLAQTDALTGEVVGAFDLSASTTDYTEVTLALGSSVASEGDTIALYRSQDAGATWAVFAYAQAHDGKLIFELATGSDAGRFALVNKSRSGGAAPTVIGTYNEFKTALQTGGTYSASASIPTPHRYMNKDATYATRFELHGATLAYTEPSDLHGLTFADASVGPVHFYFKNCTFEGLPLVLYNAGTYVFDHCTFTGQVHTTLDALTANVHLYAFGCTFADNAPDKTYWNENHSGDRHSNYAAARLRGDNSSLTAQGCTFQRMQTNSTIIFQRISDTETYPGMKLVYERNTMTDTGGAGIVMDNPVRGRIEHNTFRNIGGVRGANGYDATGHATLGETDADGNYLGGEGVGGNAMFARDGTHQMRVRYNDITNVMENGIEGTYYCISNNTINTTGYRFYEGFDTVSAEGIAGAGTWYITDNVVTNVFARGIGISSWNNHPVRITGNTVTRRADGWYTADSSEGIKIRTDSANYAHVYVANNTLTGFLNKFRVLHKDATRQVEDFEIHDIGTGKLLGPVYRNLPGVQFTTARDVDLGFVNTGAAGWKYSNLASAPADATDAGTSYVRMQGKAGDNHGRLYQTFELPDEACVVCLRLRVRSNASTVQVYVKSTQPETGASYASVVEANGQTAEKNDETGYSSQKTVLSGVDAAEFRTLYVTLKARGHTDLGLWVNDDSGTQWIDVAKVTGTYATDRSHEATPDPEQGGGTSGGSGQQGSEGSGQQGGASDGSGSGSGGSGTEGSGSGSGAGGGAESGSGGASGSGSGSGSGGSSGSSSDSSGGASGSGGNTPDPRADFDPLPDEPTPGWHQDASGKRYVLPGGTLATGWHLIANDWYLFDASGRMVTGWVLDGGHWYYLNPDGPMHTGWLWDGEGWYRMDGNGQMFRGWTYDDGWYYLGTSGALKMGWQKVENVWFYLNTPERPGYNGLMRTGWLWDDGGWYYLAEDGALQFGRFYDNTGVLTFTDGTGRWIG